MSFPEFYDAQKVGQLFVPDTPRAIAAGRDADLSPSSQDQTRSILVLVDAQVDFVHEDGALSVPGAVDDTRRTIEWMLENSNRITTVAASLDSHVPLQIFSPTWWEDENGEHPQPYTVIRSADVKAGKWKPLYEVEWSMTYPERLEEQSKKELMIWPYHTLIGTPGHAITPALYEAIVYHSAARRSQPVFLSKGALPKTEYYSMLEPEVKVNDHPAGSLNVSFLNMLTGYDRVYIAGQAKSHCVLETVTSIMRYFEGEMAIISKLRVLIDLTSSVAHPEIDFEAMATRQFAEFAERGLQLIRSTEVVR
ncbi:MAG: cysteine hydrolase family protein [Chloroflexi bacterium]|nr:cysteine hydrolase family protein [Chloroflexota bacterium]